jgi:EAL domain-containing protein (putative c-di-GMP-specific phosphodiesterase class I)
MAHDDGVKSNVACYSKEAYRRQFFQSQLATHVSEAIDNNHLALYYRQVVDAGRNNCDHYYVGLNLSNYAVDDKVIYEVIKKRDMTKLIERYMIHKALFELEEMYKEIKVYMNFSFKVSRETLVDETFKDYLLEQLKFFNIPKTAITICYNDELDDNVYEVLKSLTLNQIMIATSNVEILKQFPVYYFYYKLNKDVKNLENEFITVLKDYCDKHNIRFVLDNVNNKTLIAHFAQVGISLYSGKIYSALLTHKDIIKSFLA